MDLMDLLVSYERGTLHFRGLFRNDVCPRKDDFLAAHSDFALSGHFLNIRGVLQDGHFL